MNLPFTTAQFFDVIERYNNMVWPAQVVLTIAALGAVLLLFIRRPWSSPIAWSILTLLWAWNGVVYHFAFFATINAAAYAFGVLFLAGAAAFLWLGVVRRSVTLVPSRTGRTYMGGTLIVYALVVYPLWSTVSGHPYPALPTFGLPCPTTIFTIGVLCMASGRGHWITLVAPILWSLVGVQAAFLFLVLPDLGLGVAALVAVVLAASAVRSKSGVAPL